ncbi:MAG: DUF1830 domain-containing protein [Synechococcaceae cyanobacterium]|nr:DUF1830 domain-containing protein [Synechococcaceae cyanobacterium]
MEMWNCAYRNEGTRMVILRCRGAEHFYLEKVVFPFETWPFQCPPGSEVEVWTHSLGGAELHESHPARNLLIDVEEQPDAVPVPLGFAGIVMAPEWEAIEPVERTEEGSLPPSL